MFEEHDDEGMLPWREEAEDVDSTKAIDEDNDAIMCGDRIFLYHKQV